jgi:hypothetical protein
VRKVGHKIGTRGVDVDQEGLTLVLEDIHVDDGECAYVRCGELAEDSEPSLGKSYFMLDLLGCAPVSKLLKEFVLGVEQA